MGDATVILEAIRRGEPRAAEELIPLVYDELRHLAASRLANESPGQTLQATELVHEAYLRLVATEAQGWDGRRHFFAAAAEAMRRILIERARRKRKLRHGGGLHRVSFEAIELPAAMPDDQLLALNDALEDLVQVDAAAAALVKQRFFVGLSQGQAAELLGLSRRTADRLWAFARAWLFRQMRSSQGQSGSG
jgi:RNA polymerase sigma factor (TIGR02999 family)